MTQQDFFAEHAKPTQVEVLPRTAATQTQPD